MAAAAKKIGDLEQAYQLVVEENKALKEQNQRTQQAYDEAQAQIAFLRGENQGLQDRVIHLETKVNNLTAAVVERDARDLRRDEQIALLMDRLNTLPPQQPVLLVPHNEPLPALLPAPMPIAAPPALPLPVAIQAPNQQPPIAQLQLVAAPEPKLLPAPVVNQPLRPPVVDNDQILAIVERWCTVLEDDLKNNALMPLRQVTMPQGIVVDREEIAYQAFDRIHKTLEKLIEFQAQERISKNTSQYKEPPSITHVRRNILNLVPLSDRLLNHLEVMIAAIKITGWAFEKASPEVKNKREAALIAICRTPGAFAVASVELRDDIHLARFAFFGELSDPDLHQIEALGFSPNNKQKFWRASNVCSSFKNTGPSLEHVGNQVKANKPFVLKAVQKNPLDVMHAGELRKNNDADKKIARAAVQGYGYALRFLPAAFRDDLDVATDAVAAAAEAARENGDSRAFEFVSTRLQKNPELLLAISGRKNGP